MSDWLDERLIEATPRRVREAREQGHVPRSRELVAAGCFAGVVALLSWRGPHAFAQLQTLFRDQLSATPWQTIDIEQFVSKIHLLTMKTAVLALPYLLGMVLCAVLLSIAQQGVLWLPSRIVPDLSRASPLTGFQRVFSLQRMLSSILGSTKLLILTAVLLGSAWRHRDELFSAGMHQVDVGYHRMVQGLLHCSTDIIVVLVIFALLDYGIQKWQHSRSLRMTDVELRDETKSREGDPVIARKRRQVHRGISDDCGSTECRHTAPGVNRGLQRTSSDGTG